MYRGAFGAIVHLCALMSITLITFSPFCAVAQQSREMWKKIANFPLQASRGVANIRPRCHTVMRS